MKISLKNTLLIEKYLEGKLPVKERFLFEARLLFEPSFREDFLLQKKTMLIIKMYHRKKLKGELETIHNKLFHSAEKTAFQQSIYQLFK